MYPDRVVTDVPGHTPRFHAHKGLCYTQEHTGVRFRAVSGSAADEGSLSVGRRERFLRRLARPQEHAVRKRLGPLPGVRIDAGDEGYRAAVGGGGGLALANLPGEQGPGVAVVTDEHAPVRRPSVLEGAVQQVAVEEDDSARFDLDRRLAGLVEAVALLGEVELVRVL